MIRDVASYVTFFQLGRPRSAAKACQASSPKTNADLRMKIGAVFRSCSEIIWPLDLPCLRALRRVALPSYHKRPLRSTPTHGIVLALGPDRHARREWGGAGGKRDGAAEEQRSMGAEEHRRSGETEHRGKGEPGSRENFWLAIVHSKCIIAHY
jgi:hypothetical protein